MKDFLLVVQILISIVLVVIILMQARGSGLGRGFGAGQTAFTRRGLEKIIYKMTFVFAGVFILISLILLFV